MNHILERSDEVSIDQDNRVDKRRVEEHCCDCGFEIFEDGIKLAVEVVPVELHGELYEDLVDDAGESARLDELNHDVLVRVNVCDEIDVEVDAVVDVDIDVEVEVAEVDRAQIEEEISRFENWAEKIGILLAEDRGELLDVKDVVQAGREERTVAQGSKSVHVISTVVVDHIRAEIFEIVWIANWRWRVVVARFWRLSLARFAILS